MLIRTIAALSTLVFIVLPFSAGCTAPGCSTTDRDSCAIAQQNNGGNSGNGAPPPPAPAIVVSPAASLITVRTQQTFIATLQNTPNTVAPSDIRWTLAGPNCATFLCGTLNVTSGGVVTYTAPDLPPNPNADVRITASAGAVSGSVTFTVANNVSSNAELNGDYVFQFFGFDLDGQSFPNVTRTPNAIGMAGRFHADGAGSLTNVELDVAYTTGTKHFVNQIGAYTVGAGRRGTLVLNTGTTSVSLRFVVNASGNGRLIEYDSAQGSGRLGSGEFRRQDMTALRLDVFNGEYAFGLSGEIPGDPPGSGRLAMAGRFTLSNGGALTRGHETANSYGDSVIDGTSIAAINSITGRTTSTWTMPNFILSLPLTATFAIYVIDKDHAFLITTSDRAAGGPNNPGLAFLLGEARAQRLPASGIYLDGSAIYYTSATGLFGSFPNTTFVPVVTAGKLDFSQSNTLTGTINSGRLDQFANGVSTPYAVSSGRITVNTGVPGLAHANFLLDGAFAASADFYLTGADEGFVVGRTRDSGAAGFLEPQIGVASGIEGDWVGATAMPALSSAANAIFTLRLSNGLATGVADFSTSLGVSRDGAYDGTYTPGLSAAGRYAFILTSPLQGDFIGWHLRADKLLLVPLLNNGGAQPVFYIAER